MYVMCMHVSLSLPTNIFWIILFGVCVGCTVRIEWGVAAISCWNHSIHHLFHITIAKKIASWENDPTQAIRHHRFKFNKILCVLLNYHTKIEHRFAYINRAARLYNQIIFLYVQRSHTHQNHHQQQQQQWPKAARVTQQKKKKNQSNGKMGHDKE